MTVYAGASACGPAGSELTRAGREAGSVRVRLVCAAPVESGGGGLDLAAAGADARRAVEDSRAVAYLEAPGPAVGFMRPILDEAEVALIVDDSGRGAMATVLSLLGSRSSDESPRESVYTRSASASSISVKRNA